MNVIDVDEYRSGKRKRVEENEILAEPSKRIIASTSDEPFMLSTIAELPPDDNVNCITLEEIMGDSDISEMLQLNFTVNLPFMMSKVHPNCRNRIPITVIHGMRQSAPAFVQAAQSYKNIRFFMAPTPIPYGTHHTKAMLLFKENPAKCRLIVHTANLIHFDWNNTTQYVWQSPWCVEKTTSESSLFERDLVKYLKKYERQAERFAAEVTKYDWSEINAVLIGSVPGRFDHKELHEWGHMRLRKVLQGCVKRAPDTDVVVCQFSSIGSLGKTDKWLQDEFGTSLRATMTPSFSSKKPPIKLVYPCVQDIRDSLNGWDSGEAIHYDASAYPTQTEWMKPLLHKWVALKSGRHRAAPHIKTYMRFSCDGSNADIRWSLLTSSNLSKAAWGSLEKKDTQLMVRSWELGVLVYANDKRRLVPSWKSLILDQDDAFAVSIRMPYDLPLTPYSKEDEIWSMRASHDGVDWMGRKHEM